MQVEGEKPFPTCVEAHIISHIRKKIKGPPLSRIFRLGACVRCAGVCLSACGTFALSHPLRSSLRPRSSLASARPLIAMPFFPGASVPLAPVAASRLLSVEESQLPTTARARSAPTGISATWAVAMPMVVNRDRRRVRTRPSTWKSRSTRLSKARRSA